MKKLFFGILLITAAFTNGCRQDSQNPEALADLIANSRQKTGILVDQLPVEVVSQIELNYAPFFIEDAWHAPGDGYEIWLSDGQELYFNERGVFLHRRHHDRSDRGYGPAEGRCMRGDTIDVDALPGPVSAYIAAHYPDATIDIVVDKRGRLYAVSLSNDVILLFNRNGSYIRECDGVDRFVRRCMFGREVRPAMLPAEARAYIADHYPDAYIHKVVLKLNGVLAVLLSDGSVLLFRPAGGFIGLCD
ncbi:MAG: PepSY-like domain-containing protein [Saprospiraceae bacterium]|nr:PepSY-like domain-containing protein [Saprospiraceae bacterium]MCB0543990.1 PepSY-like domain-containing protein [Saprospiraceae bacterium]MCB0573667.1 PepSY-like domain-containing protein [Saprospiraceae bacterium]MCB9308089.1 PepSY-like domain-containing protein [Lewinellaceae bacterium]MCB9353589.1 PepSY-like domain-containing protein [Lewinellaceae bacterium]